MRPSFRVRTAVRKYCVPGILQRPGNVRAARLGDVRYRSVHPTRWLRLGVDVDGGNGGPLRQLAGAVANLIERGPRGRWGLGDGGPITDRTYVTVINVDLGKLATV